MALQFAVMLCPPEVTVTVATFEPEVEYDFETEEPEPYKPSVPAQEYVYEPLPPEAEELQVIASPVFADEGLAEQVAVRLSADAMLGFTPAYSKTSITGKRAHIITNLCIIFIFLLN